MKRLLFLLLVVGGIGACYYFINRNSTPEHLIIENWETIFLGKWEYSSTEEIEDRTKITRNGSLEFRRDSSYVLRLTIQYYDIVPFLDKPLESLQETAGGTVSGVWSIYNNGVVVLKASSCNLQHGDGVRKLDTSSCYEFAEFGLGNWNGDNEEMVIVSSSNNEARFEKKTLSSNAKETIFLKRK